MSTLGYRGRLLCPIKIGVARIDTATTEANTDFDSVFMTPKVKKTFGARGAREKGRREFVEVKLLAQSEIIDFNKMQQGPGGNVPDYRVSYIVHYKQLEDLGLIDATTQKPLIGINDRIVAKYHNRSEALLRAFTNPEIFVVAAVDAGEGFDGRTNLLVLVTSDRPQGLAETP